MSKFRDKLNREWVIDVTMGSAAQVEQDLGIDLLRWIEDPTSAADNRTVFRIVGSLAADQIAARLGKVGHLDQLEPDQVKAVLREFADGFDGPALERAGAALAEALLFFSQPSRIAKAALPKLRAVIQGMQEQAAAAIEAQDFSNLAGLSPASQASTPAA